MNDGLLIEIVHGSHDPILEFLFGRDADVAEDGAGKFREEALDEVEPGAVLGSEGEFKAVRGLIGEPGFGLFGDVRGMIVEDQLDRCVGRIGGVEKLEEFDEFAAAMAILDQRMDLAGDEVDADQQADRAVTFIFMLTCDSSVISALHVTITCEVQRIHQCGSLAGFARILLLFRQGVPPHTTYLFKHALVQDAAYGTLLREPRRALHARIAETLEDRFADIAEAQPELLARHCTEAGLIEKAAGLWGKAGQRSLARAALLEGAEQLKRALDQIATLPASPALRREEIKLRVAFANALALTGDFVDGREHYDRALAIYDPAEHRSIATSSGRDVGVTLLSFRSACLWLLGYPAASRNDAERAVRHRTLKHLVPQCEVGFLQ